MRSNRAIPAALRPPPQKRLQATRQLGGHIAVLIELGVVISRLIKTLLTGKDVAYATDVSPPQSCYNA